MKLTKLKYFLLYVILLVLPLSFVAIASYFIPALNVIAFKTYYTYYGGMCLSFASLIILFLTYILIKNNFKNTKIKIDNLYLLKINLIFVIFHIIIIIISSILKYFNVDNYFLFALYFFYPLMYFCLILFLEHKKLNKKSVITILLSIYLLWYLLVPFMSFIIGNRELLRQPTFIKSLSYNLLYNFLKYSLLVMPFMTLGLIKTSNEKKSKSVVNKFNFSIQKLVVVALVVLAIAVLITILINR